MLRHAPTEEAKTIPAGGPGVHRRGPQMGEWAVRGRAGSPGSPARTLWLVGRARGRDNGLMARPLRNQWRIRALVRRRHRTWMASMILASCGWGIWWLALIAVQIWPKWSPSTDVLWWGSCCFALPGLGLALFSFRAHRIWLLLVTVPVLANLSLLTLPLYLGAARRVLEL